MDEQLIYATLGRDGIQKIAASFYKHVKTDDLIGPMYPQNDWDGAEERFRDFLLFRFGAIPDYLQKRGHPKLRARHLPFSIGTPERDRWLQIMNQTLSETVFDLQIREQLTQFFTQVADFMRNQPEN